MKLNSPFFPEKQIKIITTNSGPQFYPQGLCNYVRKKNQHVSRDTVPLIDQKRPSCWRRFSIVWRGYLPHRPGSLHRLYSAAAAGRWQSVMVQWFSSLNEYHQHMVAQGERGLGAQNTTYMSDCQYGWGDFTVLNWIKQNCNP